MVVDSRLFRRATAFILTVHSFVRLCIDEHLQHDSHDSLLNQSEGGKFEDSKSKLRTRLQSKVPSIRTRTIKPNCCLT